MKKYITHTVTLKTKLTTTNLNKLIENNLVPNNFEFEKEVIRFKKFVFGKKYLYKTIGSKKWYKVDEVLALPFFEKYFILELQEDKHYKYLVDGSVIVSNTAFDKVFKELISRLYSWLQTDEALYLYNLNLLNEQWIKYVKTNNIRTWEMETCNFYNSEHELSDIDKIAYNICNYFDLPETPIVTSETMKRGRLVKTLQISSIMGTVIDKNTIRHTISLLTIEGVVTVKLSKGAFNFYNKQISKLDASTGKKTVLEKSWFGRGTLLIIKGFRDGNQFRARAYSGHSILKITGIRDKKYLWLQTERVEE